MKIYEHEVEIFFDGKTNIAKTTEHNVLGSNDRYLVIDNFNFSTYQLKKEKRFNLYPSVEEISVLDWSGDNIFNKIIISVITVEPDFKKVRAKLANQFDKWLYEKHGRFVQSFTTVSDIIKNIEIQQEA